ncbi:MAG: adaptor protein MecA [Clostridia bacterium]|nr:adaptor protein MecA [Clostridia bacterium]
MRVEFLTDDAIIVELTDEDMKSLNITYEEMDYSKIETKRVIWTILSRAGKTLGREINTSGRMLVEAIRKETGGCVLFFTVERKAVNAHVGRYLVRKTDYIVCELKNIRELLSCAFRLSLIGDMRESRLYVHGGSYRLAVKNHTAGAGLLKPCLSEFGKVVGEGALVLAQTAEHWHCITKENAVGLLCLSSGRGAS